MTLLDPVGAITKSSGEMASANTFRFSTKQFEPDIGIGYWGYRWYAPNQNRWLSRDPKDEKSFQNTFDATTAALGSEWQRLRSRLLGSPFSLDFVSPYVFAGNAPASKWDMLGCAVCLCPTTGPSLGTKPPGGDCASKGDVGKVRYVGPPLVAGCTGTSSLWDWCCAFVTCTYQRYWVCEEDIMGGPPPSPAWSVFDWTPGSMVTKRCPF